MPADSSVAQQLVRENVTTWTCARPGRTHRRRAAPTQTWSTLEYACHVRDVYRRYLGRIDLMLAARTTRSFRTGIRTAPRSRTTTSTNSPPSYSASWPSPQREGSPHASTASVASAWQALRGDGATARLFTIDTISSATWSTTSSITPPTSTGAGQAPDRRRLSARTTGHIRRATGADARAVADLWSACAEGLRSGEPSGGA